MARNDKLPPKKALRAPACHLMSEPLTSAVAAKWKLKSSKFAKDGADPMIASKTDLL
jgi:hypothetical protein